MFVGTLAFSWLSDRWAGARSSPSRCSGIRSAPLSWRFKARRRRSICGASSPASGLASSWSMSTPICRSWCRKNSAARLSRSIRAVMYTAVPVIAFLAWQLVPTTILGLSGWRWVVIIGSVGALVIWWIRRNLPELPRWLAQHGRLAEAEAIVAEWSAAPKRKSAANCRRRKRSPARGRKARRLDRDVERGLSRPHHHAGGFPASADRRLLRLQQLGADILDLARHRRDQDAAVYVRHRALPHRSGR